MYPYLKLYIDKIDQRKVLKCLRNSQFRQTYKCKIKIYNEINNKCWQLIIIGNPRSFRM